MGDLASHHRSQERQGQAAASAKARSAAREPDEPAIPIGRQVWPPHRNLPAARIHWARTHGGELRAFRTLLTWASAIVLLIGLRLQSPVSVKTTANAWPTSLLRRVRLLFLVADLGR